MPDQIHLTVATVVHRDGKFLMVREREAGEEVINQPAGHVEPGETLQQAALRETLEETGWHVELTGFLGISTYRSPRNGATYYRVSFAAEPLHADESLELDADIISAEWLDLDAIHNQRALLRSPLVLSVIEHFLSGPVYPLDIISNLNGNAP
ncbi:MAG: hypothetical protein VR73_11545 [Gammaproteobacteria bacterium BRH_c0]|nr:MAG: hypothetical protein VR73_11545 [Gammaproteobacteria bacterium BRH_c0]